MKSDAANPFSKVWLPLSALSRHRHIDSSVDMPCEVVRWLLAAGASLEHRNAEGMSPLMAAAAGEQSEVLSLISQVAGEAVADLWLRDVQHHPQLLLNFLESGL
eukprot:s7452_g3.t1